MQTQKKIWNDIWPVILLAIGAALVFNQGFALLNLAPKSSGFQNAQTALFSMDKARLLLISGVIVPLVEEILFRFVIYAGLKRILKSITLPCFGSALAFGLYHRNLIQFIYGFCMTLFIVYVYERYMKLFSAVLFHMSANIFVILTHDLNWLNGFSVRIVTLLLGLGICILVIAGNFEFSFENKENVFLLKTGIMFVGVMLCLIFGLHKNGYYIDEYYTYTLSNGTQLGIGIDMDSWCETDAFMDQLVSTGEENFSFNQCYVNNENDVHPPLYYFIIHIVSSMMPGVFSKWIGIGVNIGLWLLTYILAGKIAGQLCDGEERIVILCQLVYSLSPAIISGVMLVRMYVQLQLFVMLYAYIILKDIKREDIRLKEFLLPVFLTGFCGFLTQYYFVIAMFFLSFFYAVNLLFVKKQIKRLLAFGMAALSGLIATYFVWPVSVFHIFKGYRGADSVNALMDSDNIADRVKLFGGNLNRNVYGGLLFLVIAALVYITIKAVLDMVKKKEKLTRILGLDKGIVLISMAAISYFIIILKIGLKAEDASNRYEYPVYGIFLILTVILFVRLLEKLPKVSKNLSIIMTGALILLMIMLAYNQKQVLYLYPEEGVIDEYKQARPECSMLMFCKDDGGYDTRIKDYLDFDQVYFANSESPENLKDVQLSKAESLLVYIDASGDEQACLEAVKKLTGMDKSEYLLKVKAGGFRVWGLYR